MVKLNLDILWQDDDMMVVNKLPHVVVNRAESVGSETVFDWAEQYLEIDKKYKLNSGSRDEEVFVKRCGVAHRLDKETSGCLLIAKNPKALSSLLHQFHDRITKKEYLALVHGMMTPREGVVRLPLSRSRYDREKWEIKYSGKMAETGWHVESYFNGYTLVRLFPKTGRTHQIRVHLSHMGYPIFSDEKYLTRSLIEGDREKLPFHFLHAEKIGFKKMNGEWQEVCAPLPDEAKKLLLWFESE